MRKNPLLFWLDDQLSFGLITVLIAIALGLMITKNVKKSLVLGLIAVSSAYGGSWVREKRRYDNQKQFKTVLIKEIWSLEERLQNLESHENQLYQAIASAQTFSQNMELQSNRLRVEHFYLVDQISSLHQRRDEFHQLLAQLHLKKQKLESELTQLSETIKQTIQQKESLEKHLLETTHNMKLIENSCDFSREKLEQFQSDVLKNK